MHLDPKACENYYCAQVQTGGGPYFQGVGHQRGYGMFSNLFRFITPIAMKAGKYLGKHLLSAGSKVVSDVAAGASLKDSAKSRFRETTKKIKDDILHKIQTGSACTCVTSDLDLFNVSPVQLSIDSSSFIEVHPIASLGDNTPIEFFISASGEHYLDLSHVLIHLQAKITKKSGTAIGTTDQVAPINYFLNTLFSECSVVLNDKQVSSQANYAYRSIFDAMLAPKSVQESILTAGLFTKIVLLSTIR
ncbi:uncharacterized protein TNCV_2944361 [Trichonephila clavipes]|nr:uncharacterized protein TNCV_2944361 [Trichonephila clavipes]